MGVIGIVKGSERGLIDNFLLKRKVRGFVRVEFVQLLYGGKRQGSFGRGNVVFRCFGFGWWRLLKTSAGITISESMTPGDMVIDIG